MATFPSKAAWLTERGHNPGRGRPSAAKQKALADFYASGNTFADEEAKRNPKSGDGPKARPQQASPAAKPVTKPSPKSTDVIEPAQQLWPDNVVYKDTDGKVVSHKEVCVNCRASMPWCKCRVPVALGHKERSMITRTVAGKEFFGFFLT